VGPGYYFDESKRSFLKPTPAGATRAAIGGSAPRDPLDMDRLAADKRPGVGAYNLNGSDLSQEAARAKKDGLRNITIGTQRAQTAAARTRRPPTSHQSFGGTRSSSFFAYNGVAPYQGGGDMPPAIPPPKIGIAIPAFNTTALRKGFGEGEDVIPAPTDYTIYPPPSRRAMAARMASSNRGFSTSRRFLPSERELQMLSNPDAGEYDPFPPYPGSISGGGSSRWPSLVPVAGLGGASPRSSLGGGTTTATTTARPSSEGGMDGKNNAGAAEPLPEWHLTSDLRIPTARTTFNAVGLKGKMMAVNSPRSSLVSRDSAENPGPADYSPRKP
jgi:hypothetical protein